MNFQIQLTKKALRDLQSIAGYYGTEQLGLGEKFMKYFASQLSKLKMSPHAFRSGLKENTREMVMHDFPFIISYKVVNNKKINILTIYHQRRQIP